MAKRSSKIDEIVEAISDDKIINALANKLQEKILHEWTAKFEAKLEDFLTSMQSNLKSVITQVATEIITEEISPCKNELIKLDKRMNSIEAKSLQNDMVITGLKLSEKEKLDQSNNKLPKSEGNLASFDLVLDHIKKDLEIDIEKKDINFVYRISKNVGSSVSSPLMIGFNSFTKKNEIMRKVKMQEKKAGAFRSVFYNDRLTKMNAQISFLARSLQRTKKIASTWIFRGEVYIRKEIGSNPIKICDTKALDIFK